jgi:RNA methyltransferase, TrmH family
MPSATITSSKNPLLKEIRKAAGRGTLTDSGLAVAESFHLLEEAIRSDAEIVSVIAADSVSTTVLARTKGLESIQVTSIPDALLQQISATETSQGVITLVRPRAWGLDQVFRGQSLVIVLDGVQDPGNAGAILRAAEAFGASGALLVKGTVNPYNPKAMRASAGSVFRLPLATQIEAEFAVATLKQNRVDLYAAGAHGEKAIADVDLRRRCAIIIGSEGRGVSDAFRSEAAGLRIPITQVESLNAAVAAGILLYEARRQRQFQE